jgi:hypothetical protein
MLRVCCIDEIPSRMAMRSAYIILVKEPERKLPLCLETWITNGARGRNSKESDHLFVYLLVSGLWRTQIVTGERMDVKCLCFETCVEFHCLTTQGLIMK